MSSFVKLLLLNLCTVAVTLLVYGWSTFDAQHKAIQQTIVDKNRAVVKNLAFSVARSMSIEDFAEIESTLRRAAESPDIVSIDVLRNDSTVVLSMVKKEDKILLLPQKSHEISPQSEIMGEGYHKDGSFFIDEPIELGAQLGRLHIHVSQQELQSLKDIALKNALWMGLVMIFASVVSVAAALRRPVEALEQACEFVSTFGDDSSKTIKIPTVTKEIDALIKAINSRSHAVAESKKMLADSEERYRLLFDNIQIGITLIDKNFQIVMANKTIENWLGKNARSLVGKTCFGEYEGRCELCADCPGSFTLKNNQEASFQSEWIRSDDSKFAVFVRTFPILDESGNVEGFVELAEDVSLALATKEKLERTSALAQSVLDSATESAIIATDTEGVITIFNKGAQRMLGYDPLEIVGKTTPTLFHLPSELESVASELSKKLDIKIGSRFELFKVLAENPLYAPKEWWYITKDKRIITVWLTMAKMCSEDGTIVGYMGVAMDISHLKAVEADLRAAKERSEQANKVKQEFLANISHEIRTPMNAILGFAQLLKDGVKEEKYSGYLDGIAIGGKNLLSLINDLLDLSKMEAQMLQLNVAPADVRQIFEDMIKLFAVKADEKKVSLQLELSEGLPRRLEVDEFRLRQILTNLLSNALKFTESGFVKLAVYELPNRFEADKIDLTIEVQDSGIGIPRAQIRHIFDSFTQVDGQNSRKYGGTGLGLAITKKLVTLMNGSVSVDSEEGKGCVFKVVIEGLIVSASVQMQERVGQSIFKKESFVVKDETARILLNEFVPKWNQVKIVASNDDIRAFAKELLMKGEECDDDALIGYAQKLLRLEASFKIDALNGLFLDFESLAKRENV